MATKTNCVNAAGAAMPISAASPLRAPMIGIVLWISAKPSASIKA